MQTEALEGEKVNRSDGEAVRTAKRKMVDRQFRKLFHRSLKVAMGRWRDICNEKRTSEESFKRQIVQYRRRLLRQAFDEYLAFYKKAT